MLRAIDATRLHTWLRGRRRGLLVRLAALWYRGRWRLGTRLVREETLLRAVGPIPI